MKPLSISQVASNAGVTIQAVSIALNDGRLTTVEVIDRRAVKQDAKYDAFLKSTRNRGDFQCDHCTKRLQSLSQLDEHLLGAHGLLIKATTLRKRKSIQRNGGNKRGKRQ